MLVKDDGGVVGCTVGTIVFGITFRTGALEGARVGQNVLSEVGSNVGSVVGDVGRLVVNDGFSDGFDDGDEVGEGPMVGWITTIVAKDGDEDGSLEGISEDGTKVEGSTVDSDGSRDGIEDGRVEGIVEVRGEGRIDEREVGTTEGEVNGLLDGSSVITLPMIDGSRLTLIDDGSLVVATVGPIDGTLVGSSVTATTVVGPDDGSELGIALDGSSVMELVVIREVAEVGPEVVTIRVGSIVVTEVGLRERPIDIDGSMVVTGKVGSILLATEVGIDELVGSFELAIDAVGSIVIISIDGIELDNNEGSCDGKVLGNDEGSLLTVGSKLGIVEDGAIEVGRIDEGIIEGTTEGILEAIVGSIVVTANVGSMEGSNV